MDADTAETDARALLADALDLDPAMLAALSREPLGAGSVSGFVITGTVSLPDDTVAYVDTSQLPVARETGLVLEGEARVWVHPADPHLPALAPAAFGDATVVFLSRLGLTATAAPQLVGYRPGRRAVLRVPTGEGAAWVKVVRPRRVQRVVDAHAALRDHGLPVPAVRGWSPEGLLVLDAASGEAATDGGWEPESLLDAVTELRSRLATVPLGWQARTSVAARLSWYAPRLIDLLPHAEGRIRAVAGRADAALATLPRDIVAIHGDLHIGQLFLAGGEVAGLIDVDTAGLGDPADDTAAFIGHAVASALLTAQIGGDASLVRQLAVAAEERWGADARVAALTAVHLLGHALGAASAGDHDRADALVRGAEALIARPAQAAKSPLIVAFEGP